LTGEDESEVAKRFPLTLTLSRKRGEGKFMGKG